VSYVDFDPDAHGDRELFEIVGDLDEEGQYRTYLVPVDISHEEARNIPWYFVVWEDE
jgi:hypothetical protein